MGELRIALILIGIAILAGIYVYHQWRSSRDVDEIFSGREATEDVLLVDDTEPEIRADFSAEDPLDDMQSQLEEESALMGGSSFQRDQTVEQKVPERVDPRLFDMQSTQEVTPIDHFNDTVAGSGVPGGGLIVMHILATEDRPFRGQAVLKALQVHKMRFGEFNIYHRITDDEGQPESIFSIANMVKPGTLSPVELPQMKLPGLTFFLRLPATGGDRKAFDDMLHVAQEMADLLEGSLNDEKFSAMTDDTIRLLRSGLE